MTKKKKRAKKKPVGYRLPDGSGFFVMTIPRKNPNIKKKRKKR